jgi:hypothetical protein
MAGKAVTASVYEPSIPHARAAGPPTGRSIFLAAKLWNRKMEGSNLQGQNAGYGLKRKALPFSGERHFEDHTRGKQPLGTNHRAKRK